MGGDERGYLVVGDDAHCVLYLGFGAWVLAVLDDFHVDARVSV